MKTFVALAAIALFAAVAPARADNNDRPFDFFKFLSGGGEFVSAGSGPIPRQSVSIDPKYRPGTIVIRTGERRLYYVTSPGHAIRYGIGVGRDGFRWYGVKTVS